MWLTTVQGLQRHGECSLAPIPGLLAPALPILTTPGFIDEDVSDLAAKVTWPVLELYCVEQ